MWHRQLRQQDSRAWRTSLPGDQAPSSTRELTASHWERPADWCSPENHSVLHAATHCYVHNSRNATWTRQSHFTVHRLIYVYLCVLCSCFILHNCCITVSMVGWTWWDWSLILRNYLPSVLVDTVGWVSHLTVFGGTLNLAISIYLHFTWLDVSLVTPHGS